MKINFNLIITFLSLLFIGQISGQTYVNFIPSTAVDCSSGYGGIGYSIQIETCFSLDNVISYYISQNSNNLNQFTLTGYKTTNGQPECQLGYETEAIKLDGTSQTCYPAFNFNNNYNPLVPYYYAISSSVFDGGQVVLPKSVVSSYTYNTCYQTAVIEYVTSGTTLGLTYAFGDTATFTCDSNNNPTESSGSGSNQPNSIAQFCQESSLTFNNTANNGQFNSLSIYCSI